MSMDKYDTECLHWDLVSLSNTKLKLALLTQDFVSVLSQLLRFVYMCVCVSSVFLL